MLCVMESMNFAEFYQQGGAFMHYVTLAGLFGLVVGVVALAVRSRPLGLSALALALVCLMFGGVGTYLGFVETEKAVATVSEDQREIARAMGHSIAVHPIQWAVPMSGPALICGLIALVIGRPRKV